MNIIVTDLDGTLLNNNGEVSENTKKYLMNRRVLGDKLVVSSGRSLFSCKSVLKDFQDQIDYFVLQNGAVIYDKDENVIYEKKLEKEVVKEIYDIFNLEKGLDLVYFGDNQINSLIDPKVAQEIMRDKKTPKVLVNIDDLKEDVYKVLFLGKNETLLNVKDIVDQYKVTSCFSCPTFLEVNGVGVSKGYAVQNLIRGLSDVDEVYIFGDNDNDVSMLLLDYNTVAMNNGTKLAKDVAKYETKYDNDKDGLIHFLIEEFESEKEEHALDSLKDDILITLGRE